MLADVSNEKVAWFQDAERGSWYRFSGLIDEQEVHVLEEVQTAISTISEKVEKESVFAVLLLSYEAGAAFDEAFPKCDPVDQPLLFAQIFQKREQFSFFPVSKSDGEVKRKLGELHFQQSESAQSYEQKFAEIQNSIQQGESYQVNFTFQQEASFQAEPFEVFSLLAQSGCSRYGAYLQHERFSFISLSPELFFRLDKDSICTEPMKGTLPRGLSYASDLRAGRKLHRSEKDRAENVMIVDLLRNDLSRIAKGNSVEPFDMFRVGRLPNVWQMTSKVRAKTDASIVEIFRALFPCASVTGAPKASTMHIIDRLESTPRGMYTGALGFLAPGREALFNVAIRSLVHDRKNQALTLGTGSGLTSGSEAGSEYRECLKKASFVKSRVADFCLLETLLWKVQDGFWLLPYHVKRMLRSARYFGFPLEARKLQEALRHCVPVGAEQEYCVRCLCDPQGDLHIETKPFEASHSAWKVGLAKEPIDSKDMFLYHKTTERSVYDRHVTAQADLDEVILFNEKGELTEGCRSNLALRFGETWLTPKVSSGLLPGTFRQKLLVEGRLQEASLRKEDLARADEIAVLNSLRGWIELEFQESVEGAGERVTAHSSL